MPSAEGIQEALNALVPRNYTHDVRIAPQSATPEELRAYTEFKRQRVRGGLGEKGQAFTDRHDETLDSAHPHRSPPPWKLSELTKQHIHKHAPTSHDSVEQAVRCSSRSRLLPWLGTESRERGGPRPTVKPFFVLACMYACCT